MVDEDPITGTKTYSSKRSICHSGEEVNYGSNIISVSKVSLTTTDHRVGFQAERLETLLNLAAVDVPVFPEWVV